MQANTVRRLILLLIILSSGCSRNDRPPSKAPRSVPTNVLERRKSPAKRTPAKQPPSEEGSASPKETRGDHEHPIAKPSSAPSADAPQIDRQRLGAAGIRTVAGKHLTLYTDLPPDETIDALPGVFDMAVAQWCDYFAVDRGDAALWQARGCLMSDAAPFKAAGLLPDNLPQFANGYTRGHAFWWFEQKSDYYRRHLMLHEGTHSFLFCRFGTCGPPWYMEATAELLGTHHLEDNRLTLGWFPADRNAVADWGRVKLVRDAVRSGSVLAIDEILSYGPDAHLQNEAYGWCWAIGAFLDGHPRYRDRFRSLAKAIKSDDFNNRFRALFADQRWQLELEWQAFLHELDYGYDLTRGAIEFREAKPLTDENRSVNIAADRGWQSSGIRLSAGEEYTIAATGRYQVADRPQPWWCEPNGVTIRYYAGRRLGMLLAMVVADAGEWPVVIATGAKASLSPQKSGTLYLRINDSPAELADNAGTLMVTIDTK